MSRRARIALTAICLAAALLPGVGREVLRPVCAEPVLEARQRDTRSAPTQGAPTTLRLDGDVLTYCDRRGARRLDLLTSADAEHSAACTAPAEPNTACSGLGLDIEVRSPAGEPDDVIDLAARSVPVKGRVRDCARDGGRIAVAAGSSIVVINTGAARYDTITDGQGGERIALGRAWVVWSHGARLHWTGLSDRTP